MIMGIIILKKRYDFSKYLSVFMITGGIIVCTIISGSDVVSLTLLLIGLEEINNRKYWG